MSAVVHLIQVRAPSKPEDALVVTVEVRDTMRDGLRLIDRVHVAADYERALEVGRGHVRALADTLTAGLAQERLPMGYEEDLA